MNVLFELPLKYCKRKIIENYTNIMFKIQKQLFKIFSQKKTSKN